MKLAAGLLGALTLAGTAAIVACLGPEQPAQPPAPAKAAPRPSASAAAPFAEPVPEPRVVTIGPPPAEGEFAAPAPTPQMARKRLHLVVSREGKPVFGAELMRLFPDGGFEGLYGNTDPLGRLDVDIITEQGPLDLFLDAPSCKKSYFNVDPKTLQDGELREIAMLSGPELVSVRFVADQPFPKGFAASFIALHLLGDRRPEPEDLTRDFLKELCHPESRSMGVRPDGTTEIPIAPGRYWVFARAGNGVSSERPDLLPCCFEVTIPEGRDAQVPYAGSLGGALVLDVLGPATIGMDVSVTVEDAADATRRLWFQVSKGNGGTIHATDINVGTLDCRSEPIPAGEHTLVFHQRGKEIDRRKLTIVRGEELKLSIKP